MKLSKDARALLERIDKAAGRLMTQQLADENFELAKKLAKAACRTISGDITTTRIRNMRHLVCQGILKCFAAVLKIQLTNVDLSKLKLTDVHQLEGGGLILVLDPIKGH